VQITVEAPVEHPFFVYGKGWSSVRPDMSSIRYQLACHSLLVDDLCASLTLKSGSSQNALAEGEILAEDHAFGGVGSACAETNYVLK